MFNSIKDTNIPDLGEAYKQSRAAKEAKLKMNVTAGTTSVTSNTSYGTMTAPAPGIGSLETQGDIDVLKTFCGTQTNAGGGGGKDNPTTVPFDPSTLLCICCKTVHLLAP
jgi:hypothetical protein